MEDWQSDRMRWTRNPVYPFTGIGGLNPSSSALKQIYTCISALLFFVSPSNPNIVRHHNISFTKKTITDIE